MAPTIRTSEFGRIIPGATKRALQQQLNEMERMGLVSKEVFAETPPRVEYTLTDRGRFVAFGAIDCRLYLSGFICGTLSGQPATQRPHFMQSGWSRPSASFLLS